MTEQEWLACADPDAMLAAVQESNAASERKFRLFAVGCCRRIRPLITPEESWKAVEVAEQYADGAATADAQHAASDRVDAAYSAWDAAAWSALGTESPTAVRIATGTALAARFSVLASATGTTWGLAGTAPDEARAQALLLRDIFGPLLFRRVPVGPAWLLWNQGTVRKLAKACYEERPLPEGTLDSGRLVIAADALEEAGCDNADVLDHLRGPGPHMRGCWAVDLILGKG
jgi:hypothetical protein